MGTTSENFCLRWNDFESNISSSFRELRDDSDFFDVTLATSDCTRTLQAHKVILSASSTFFKQMLRQQSRMHSHPNPFIFLRGVSFQDLKCVLDFMYHGEVNVAQDDLNSFLAVAEELQIKGLTNKEQSESAGAVRSRPPQSIGVPRSREPPAGVPAAKRARKMSPGSSLASSSASAVVTVDDDVAEVKAESEGVDLDTGNGDDDLTQEEGYDESYGEYYGEDGDGVGDGVDAAEAGTSDGAKGLGGILKSPEGGGKCTVCLREFTFYANARRHYTNTHSEFDRSALCRICESIYKNKNALKEHMRIKHGIYQRLLTKPIE